MQYRRNGMKKIGILVIALALLFVGVTMADAGNIEVTKQISFLGEGGSTITSTEGLFLSSFANTINSGSSFDGSVVNTNTQTNSRFVIGSLNTPVSLNHNIRVTPLGNLPSNGKVTAYTEGTIMEGRDAKTGLFELMEFKERTTVNGKITLFDKQMGWVSGLTSV
jgi:hypothetical protein